MPKAKLAKIFDLLGALQYYKNLRGYHVYWWPKEIQAESLGGQGIKRVKYSRAQESSSPESLTLEQGKNALN